MDERLVNSERLVRNRCLDHRKTAQSDVCDGDCAAMDRMDSVVVYRGDKMIGIWLESGTLPLVREKKLLPGSLTQGH